MKCLKTKREHYLQYVEKHQTDRLIKNLKIDTNSKGKLLRIFSGLNEEIFNNPIQTDYQIESNSDNKILISFDTKSKMKYRLDIFFLIESDKSDNPINHIAFSDYNKLIEDEIGYEDKIGRYEMIEVMNRIHYILNDLLDRKIINNSFCIGITDSLKKNSIYEYSLKIIVGEGGFDKLSTTCYDSGFGLYFKI